MDLKIEGSRCKTVSKAIDPKLSLISLRLEGQKRWLKDQVFSFECTPFNIEVWRQAWPNAKIEGLQAPDPAEEAIFDRPSSRAPFAYKTPPRPHQAAAIEKLSQLPIAGLFADVGTGKSWVAIQLAGQRWCAGELDYWLIIAPNGVHEQWVEEAIPKHMSGAVPHKTWIFRKGKVGERQFEELLKFDGLKIFSINIDAIDTKTAEPFLLRFLRAARRKVFVTIDESQDIKNQSAGRTTMAIKLGALANFKLIMSGTPIGKSLEDLFSQFKFLDEQIIGHRYLTTFRAAYCEFTMTDYGRQLVGHKNEEVLFRRINPFIFRVSSSVLGLPPQNFDRREFNMSEKQLTVIKELKENYVAQLAEGELMTVKNAISLLVRMQQVSCGFLPMEDGKIFTFSNPRLEHNEALLEQLPGKKVIVWARFRQDIHNLMALHRGEAVSYFGENDSEEKAFAKTEFLRPDGPRYFFANPASAGTGLDGLQSICHHAVYYSNSFNAIKRWQSEGRIYRDGQVEPTFYFDLIARKSPDLKILNNLRQKKSISDLILDDIRKLIEE